MAVARRTPRRPRIQCRLRCHVLKGRRKFEEAWVTSLSEGGLGLIGPLDVEQGDPIDLCLMPERGKRALRVRAIVWSDSAASGTHCNVRRVGCVVSDPDDAFLRLLGQLEARAGSLPAASAVVAKPRPEAPARRAQDDGEADLPRSFEAQPPPKPVEEERLPVFRLRMKQKGGPRTRSVEVRARSASEAERRARAQLCDPMSNDVWEVVDQVLVRVG